MEIVRSQKVVTPEWIKEIVASIKGQLTQSTQFVCKTEDTATFGTSSRDEELVVQMNNSESVKTTLFVTDGTYVDGEPKNYRDGYVKSRAVTKWNYCIIENAVKNSEGQEKLVKTCYTKDKHLYLELRRAVGLSSY